MSRAADGARTPRKRPAFEPAAGLARPVAPDPAMRRPLSTVAGAVLVLLRAAAGGLWLASVALGWEGWLGGLLSETAGESAADQLTPEVLGVSLTIFASTLGAVFLVEAVLGLFILRGRNFPRMVVMFFSVASISTAFAGWWAAGQEIRLQTTLLTLALDILVLLALSSRSAAAYARRHERR